MLKRQRKLLMCLALLVAVSVSGGSVSAATMEQTGTDLISIQSVNTASATIGFSISNSGTASITAGVVGKAGTSKIQLIVTLQKYNSSSKSWKKIISWSKTSNSANVSFIKSYKLNSKGTYRCKLSWAVLKNGIVENGNMASVKKTY